MLRAVPLPLPLRALCLALPLLLATTCRRGASQPTPVVLRDRAVAAAGLRIFVREVRSPAAAATLVLHGGPGLDHTYLRPWLDPLSAAAPGRLRRPPRARALDARRPRPTGYTLTAAADDWWPWPARGERPST
jgi:hypothetical protein